MLNQKTQAALAESNQILSALGPVLRGDNSASDIHQVRAAYNAMQAKQPHPEDVSLTSVDMGGVPGLLITPDELKTDAVVMYIHGGGYLVGSPEGYAGIGGNYAKLVGARVYLPDYRLAPEHPFPAPIHDVLRAYEWLLEQGIAGKSIVLAGESAGGAMVVSVMVAARNKGWRYLPEAWRSPRGLTLNTPARRCSTAMAMTQPVAVKA
ncbi:Monoterpene epsilon-lactone hydrolase [Ewingella americana]|uniref:Monoterpene epsilon-lactone hydrolase n=1 Tax=Ewingella americana TaxID=41202 RepID=A0A377NDH8_9GAMM|nr:Monoterpene epsilon-lactone hydrolase [Ewingella americana]